MTASRLFLERGMLFIAFVAAAAVTLACSDGNGDAETELDGLPVAATFYGADEGDSAAALAAGDFNGDGETDLAIGAAFADGPDEGRAEAGEVYVFLGPFDGEQLDAAEGDQALTVFGATAGDNLGRSLAAADFDGDGRDDLAMGTPGAGDEAGGVQIVFGTEISGEEDLDLASNSSAVLAIRGEDTGDFAGLTLAAGDVAGDEAPDLIVPALLADGPANDRTDAGAVYLVTSLAPGNEVPLAGSAQVIYGADPGDRLGEALAAGDVSGDGRADAVLAAPFADGPSGERSDAGETYVLFGPVDVESDSLTEQADVTVFGTDAGDQLGHSVSVAGATDGRPASLWLGAVSADGRDNASDLSGEAVVVSELGRQILDTANDPVGVVHGPEPDGRLGRATASKDVDRDGLADGLISASDIDELSGALFVVLTPKEAGGGELEPYRRYGGLDEGDYLGSGAFGSPALIATTSEAVYLSAPHGDGPDNSRTDCGEVYLLDLSLD